MSMSPELMEQEIIWIKGSLSKITEKIDEISNKLADNRLWYELQQQKLKEIDTLRVMVEKNTADINNIRQIPMQMKSSAIDTVWKWICAGLGAVVTAKVVGLLQ